MAVQVQDQRQPGGRKWKRLAFMSVTFLLLSAIAVIWIINVENVLSSILSIVFTLLGMVLAVLQWQSEHWTAARGTLVFG